MMLAGPIAAPTSYKDTIIADVLPIKIGAGSWNPVVNGTHPIVTPQEKTQPIHVSFSIR